MLSKPDRFREIDPHPEQVRETILQANQIQDGKALRFIEIRHQIDIRLLVGFPSCHRSEKAQVNDAGSFQLRLVGAQFFDDSRLIHTQTLTYRGLNSNKSSLRSRYGNGCAIPSPCDYSLLPSC